MRDTEYLPLLSYSQRAVDTLVVDHVLMFKMFTDVFWQTFQWNFSFAHADKKLDHALKSWIKTYVGKDATTTTKKPWSCMFNCFSNKILILEYEWFSTALMCGFQHAHCLGTRQLIPNSVESWNWVQKVEMEHRKLKFKNWLTSRKPNKTKWWTGYEKKQSLNS